MGMTADRQESVPLEPPGQDRDQAPATSLFDLRYPLEIGHVSWDTSSGDNTTFYSPFGMLGTDGHALLFHRRGEMEVGWINYARARALSERMAAAGERGPLTDNDVEPGLCFHLIDGVHLTLPDRLDAYDMSPAFDAAASEILLTCTAGSPAVDSIAAPLPSQEQWRRRPAVLAWDARNPDGSAVIRITSNGTKTMLLGTVTGWPVRLAAPMLYVHRTVPQGQGVPRLHSVDLEALKTVADELHAKHLEGEELQPVTIDPPVKFGPKVVCHYIDVAGGYGGIEAQMEAIRREHHPGWDGFGF